MKLPFNFLYTMDSSHSPTVFVVDDDKFTRLLLRQALETENCKVVEISNGEDCIKSYQEHQPNLILLDAMMPVMTGFECCERLSILENIEYTPILIITGLEDAATIDWAFKVGATDYITKPINVAILRQRVKLLIERSQLFRELAKANKRLQALVTIDDLTQITNRRGFDEALKREWLRAMREKQPIALILCDVDCFKLYNDTYGHSAGDLCLKKIASVIDQSANRATDVTCRYGGEEFLVILPNTDLEGAIYVAQCIQNNIYNLAIPHENSMVSNYVTVSLGITSTIPKIRECADELIITADKALYEAKNKGRNQYCYQLMQSD